MILNRTGLNSDPWATPLLTGRQLDLTPFTTTLCTRLSSQFFTQQRVYLPKPQASSFSRRILWGTVLKAFSEVLVVTLQVGHTIIEGVQVDQTGPAFHESMLGRLDPLIVPYMPCNHTQDDLLHYLTWH